MAQRDSDSFELTHHIRDTCLCLHAQRAARALARRFDAALRLLGVTSGQFSLLNALNRADAPTIGAVAALLAMDRTTLTAALKPLARRRLVRQVADTSDRRIRRLQLMPAGRALLLAAIPIWSATHAAIEPQLAGADADRLRVALRRLS
jgi:DNA-binding MarR family transcriptional regulator